MRRTRILLAASAAALVVIVAIAFFGNSDDESDAGPKVAATEADNGGEVTVPPDEEFVVRLAGSEDAPWGLPQASTEALARVSTSQEADGSASATFRPLEVIPGAKVRAERVPTCRSATPACDAPIEQFEVTIRVPG